MTAQDWKREPLELVDITRAYLAALVELNESGGAVMTKVGNAVVVVGVGPTREALAQVVSEWMDS